MSLAAPQPEFGVIPSDSIVTRLPRKNLVGVLLKSKVPMEPPSDFKSA